MKTFPNIWNYLTGLFPNVFAKAASGAGAKDGTEWKTTTVDELMLGWIQKTLVKVGQTPNGVPETSTDSQIFDAMNEAFNTPEIKLLNTSAAIVFGKTNFSVEFDTSGGNLAPPILPLPDFIGQTVDFVVSGSGTATILAGSGIVFDQVISSDKGRSLVAVKVSGALQWELRVDEKRICKAWVNYNQSTNTIIDSYNVSSVTDNSIGNFTVNFTNNMNDADYIAVIGTNASDGGSNTTTNKLTGGIYTVSAMQFITQNSAGTNLDGINNMIGFFGS